MLMVGPSGSTTWVGTFNGSIVSETVDTSGNTYIVGYANGPAASVISKISPEGIVLWSYSISNNLDYTQGQICLNSSQTEVYLVAPQQSYVGNGFHVARFNVAGSLLAQKLFNDNSSFGNPYVWGAVADNSFLYVSIQGYYSSTIVANGIFKLSISSLTISAKWSYNATARIRYLTLNASGTALYAATGTNSYNFVLIKIDTNNLGVSHSTYVTWPQSVSGSSTLYAIAVDSTETNAYLAGVGYFTFSGFTQNWPIVFSLAANGSAVNWGRTARASATTRGYLDAQVDSAGNLYLAGDLYNGTVYKKQLLKLSASNVILFSNAFNGTQNSSYDFNSLKINSANSTIKYGYRGGTVIGQAFHSLPTDGSATGTYVLGSDTYTYESFTPTYYALSPSRGSAGVNIVNPFNNYGAVEISYTFPAVTVALAKKDIP
jgi:hypothetical protein